MKEDQTSNITLSTLIRTYLKFEYNRLVVPQNFITTNSTMKIKSILNFGSSCLLYLQEQRKIFCGYLRCYILCRQVRKNMKKYLEGMKFSCFGLQRYEIYDDMNMKHNIKTGIDATFLATFIVQLYFGDLFFQQLSFK